MISPDAFTSGPPPAYSGVVPWGYLAPHATTGRLFFVDPALPLQLVGDALVANDTVRVSAWLKSGDIVQLGEIHSGQWDPRHSEFEALVVTPFVLCRPKS